MPKSVLIIEDERDLATVLAYNLKREGFDTTIAHNGAEALTQLERRHPFDLVLLDLMLPDMSGTSICRQIRQKEHTQHLPVIMLTARGDEVDRVVGFEVGADDYVVKPFSVRELMLRVHSVLRRTTNQSSEVGKSVTFGSLHVDGSAHRIWVDQKEVVLTSLEFRLLNHFLQRKGRVQSREALLEHVWGQDVRVTTRTVDTHIKRLREKLGTAGAYIETVRGVGYRFRDRPPEGTE